MLATLLILSLAAVAQAAAPATQPARDATGARAQAVADADQLAAALLAVHDADAALACPKAVENARYSVETMLEVGQKNVQGGYLPAADFERSAVPLRALLPQIRLDDCEAAQGNRRAFYRCMSSDYNHALACARAHPF
ncbi:hypothetical protein D3C87_301940 [compost metagenome]